MLREAKMKPLKLVRNIILAVVLLIVVAIVLIHFFGGLALKIAVETAGTKTLNVGVSVKSIGLSLIRGKLEINKLVVNNPAGYKYTTLLELEKGVVIVSIKSLL